MMMVVRSCAALAAVLASLCVAAGCPPSTGPEDPAVTRGRKAYIGTCIACHNIDPTVDGALGPAIKGSSRALIESKVMRNEYPAGYTPKRATKTMVPLPQMAPAIDDLAAFLK